MAVTMISIFHCFSSIFISIFVSIICSCLFYDLFRGSGICHGFSLIFCLFCFSFSILNQIKNFIGNVSSSFRVIFLWILILIFKANFANFIRINFPFGNSVYEEVIQTTQEVFIPFFVPKNPKKIIL